MTNFSKTVFDKFQVRKTKSQKTQFINLIKSQYPEARVESGRSKSSRNIILGDVRTAKVLLTAHYDTCAVMPFPNFIMPKNIILSLLYGVLIALPIIIVAMLVEAAVIILTDSVELGMAVYLIALFAFLYMMMAGVANKHTANDNTSGVIQLLEIYEALSPEDRAKVAFVFFDNEELGLMGSSLFRKMHKKEIKDKLMINFDCVSDGDNIMFVLSKKANKEYRELFTSTYASTDEKNVLIERSSNTMYPSDQMGFPYGVGVAALRKNNVVGYYMSRIHTPRDTVFDERNITYLKENTINLIKGL